MDLHQQDNFLNRYPGIKPFSEKESTLFFGRQKDLDALSSLLFVKQSVVLYSKSGYGKSSLINAGIIPRLRKNESWKYFSIRFNNYSQKTTDQNLSPFKTTRQRLSENIKADESTDFYKLMPDDESLWYWIKQNQLANHKAKFIFFFDQFEELFTYPEEQIIEFSEELSQLLYTTIPARFRKLMAEFDEKDLLSDTLHDFLYEKPEIKVVFSIRSDRMSQMNMLTDRHPSILQNCYELNALDAEQAVAAIVEPARLPQDLGFNTPPFELTDGAVNKILNNITDAQDKKIEVSTLQIVCRYIEDTLVGEKKHLLITEDILGNITDIFLQYYEKVLDKLQPDERVKAQYLIEDELIFEGRRNALTAGYIQKKFNLSEELLITLEKSSLLKKERDAAGRLLYEISHDSLIAPINKVAEGRRMIENEHRQKQLEEQIQNERRRSQELVVLNERARNRSRIAIALAIVCIGIALAAIVFWRKANTAERVAQDKAEKAEKAERETSMQKNKVNILLAKQLIKEAEFLREDSITWALNSLDSARKILNGITDSLPDDIEQQKQNALQDYELKRKEISDN